MELRIQNFAFILLFLCACLCEGYQTPSTQGPEIKTTAGYVRGKIVTTPAGKRVAAFYGIPFAQPPVGDLRFKRPVPARPWDGVMNATKLPQSCSQVASKLFGNFYGEEMWNPNTIVSEDCLYLNIWAPEHLINDSGRRTAKVLFWIYGGGFASGTSTLDIYDGRVLAGEQDVVVVSVQYRVGPLGFLYFGTEDAPGSMGLLDQNLALKWTYENIRAFGGDPEGVTLFGESAGSVSCSYHLLSPLSRPYFKQVILMSGVATAPFGFNTNAESLDVSIRLAKEFGCWSTEKPLSEIASCMRDVDHARISMVQFDLAKKFLDLSFGPTIDGQFLTDEPEHLLRDPNTKKANILVGNVLDEGSYFIVYPYLSFYKSFNHLKSNPISYELLVSSLAEIFKDRPAEERDAIIHQYTNWNNLEDGFANQQLLIDAIGDAYFTCPVRDWADKWAARGMNVYYYYFTERTSTNPWGDWMGVLHGDEIEYAFGIPLTKPSKFDLSEQRLSRKMMEFWANFAKTGTPSKFWAPYSMQTPNYVNLNSTAISDQGLLTAYGPRSEQCAFWNYYLPKLRRTVIEKQNSARNVLISHGYSPSTLSALEDIDQQICHSPKSAKHRHHHGKPRC